MYTYELPVGDWSDDGHGKCERYNVISNKPLKDIREAHFAWEAKYGFKIEEICGDFQVRRPTKEQLKAIKASGAKVDFEDFGTFEFAEMYCALLNTIDPELNLVAQRNEIEMIPFYGCDEKGRHIGHVGYGMFWC